MTNSDFAVILLHNLDMSWGVSELKNAVREVDRLENQVIRLGYKVINSPLFDSDLKALLCDLDPASHIVLNWCENLPGIPKSESAVARILQEMGFTYTGSEAETIEKSWNKPQVKKMLDEKGIATPKWQAFSTARCSRWKIFPAIVKPALEHCSYGVTGDSIVLNSCDLAARIQFVVDNFKCPALVEEFLDGREFHVSVWGNSSPEIIPPAEMDFTLCQDCFERLCTYESKFAPESEIFNKINVIVPAKLSDEELEQLRDTTIKAYQASGCRDYARLDLRLMDGKFYVLDINPNPDIGDETSMAFGAQHLGYGYGQMIEKILQFAFERHSAASPGKSAEAVSNEAGS